MSIFWYFVCSEHFTDDAKSSSSALCIAIFKLKPKVVDETDANNLKYLYFQVKSNRQKETLCTRMYLKNMRKYILVVFSHSFIWQECMCRGTSHWLAICFCGVDASLLCSLGYVFVLFFNSVWDLRWKILKKVLTILVSTTNNKTQHYQLIRPYIIIPIYLLLSITQFLISKFDAV